MHLLFPQEAREGVLMKGWIRKTWMVCAVAMALGAPLAHADGGTITFVGAVVSPTCSFDAGASSGAATGGCGAATVAQLPTSVYRQQIDTLEAALHASDRLMTYFAGYAGTADTRMMTRVYD